MSKAIAEGPPSIELRAKQNQPATASATAKRSELHPRATTSLLVAARQPPHHGSAQRPDIRLSLTGHHSCRATHSTRFAEIVWDVRTHLTGHGAGQALQVYGHP